jgi:atlastin
VRDWPNDEEHAYGLEGGNSFLAKRLELSENQDPEIKAVRKDIKRCFEKIEGFNMPHPGKDLYIAVKTAQIFL